MTLPPGGGQWPPYPHGTALAQQAIWSAWYVGDPEGLKGAYTAADPSTVGNTDFFRYENGNSAAYPRAGGIIPAIARMFWSRPSLSGNRKAGLHIPMAADVATASADLLFSEPPQFTLEDGAETAPRTPGVTVTKTPAKARIDTILNCGDFHAHLIEAAELAAALGGAWLRLVWDKDVAEHVMVDAVSADAAIGEWRWGMLSAVTFFSEYTDPDAKDKVWRHLERHEPGYVLHGLYRGETDKLGYPAALDEHPSTEPYLTLVDSEGAIPTGVKGLTAAYVANMRPQRRWRKVESLCELGRSDYDGVEPLMDALDETYTSWMRDLRLAKARIIVPEFMMKNLGKGKGVAWDEDQEVYTQLAIPSPETGNATITLQQFAIRVAEHMQTTDAIVEQILDAAGYSPSTFGRGGNAVATATEVSSRDRKSSRTRQKKARYWSSALEPLLSTWLELDGIVFGGTYSGEVEVKWSPEATVDSLTMAQTVNTLHLAAAASTKTMVALVHPDWNEAQIDEEVALVQAESGASVPDLGPLAGQATTIPTGM